MSGGVAYVLDFHGDFVSRCNKEMVGLSSLQDPAEIAAVRDLVERHARWTESGHALHVLERWREILPAFVRVMPHDYRRVLEAQASMREKGLSPDEAEMAAFEQNVRDLARAGGN
jgi:glutamate synthase (ferredoxin)